MTRFHDSLVCLSNDFEWILETTGHQTTVDVIKRLVVDPQIFSIVNDEAKVRRDTGRVSIAL